MTNESTSSNGAFEACFASGLDLSEFDAKKNVASTELGKRETFSSASVRLLKIKAQEAAGRRVQEQEELRMQQAVERRSCLLRTQQSKGSGSPLSSASSGSSQTTSAFGSVLAGMHRDGKDRINQSRASRQMESKHRRMARKQQQEQKASRKGVKAKKKSNRAKF